MAEEPTKRRRKLPKLPRGRLPPTRGSSSSGSAGGSGHCPTIKRAVIKERKLKPGRVSLRSYQSKQAWKDAARIKAFYGGKSGLRRAMANALKRDKNATNYEVIKTDRDFVEEDLQ